MSKNHDENKDIRLVSRIAKIDYSYKTIQAPKSAIIGNKTWGRIDYLTHYCGWTFIWNNNVSVRANSNNSNNDNQETKRKREAKKASKEKTLTNKKKR